MKETLLAPALAVVSVDLKRALLGRRGTPLLILGSLAPLLMLLVGAVQRTRAEGELIAQYAALFRYFVLCGSLFFGVGWAFSNLFRGEILERSLHYFFLTPVRREAIALGKYITGVLATCLVFSLGTVASYVLLFGQGGPAAVRYLGSPAGLGALAAYVGITCLACVAYGAVFLALGLVAKSPFVPILGVFLAERASVVLPVMLKRFTVVHYFDSLLPVPAPSGPLALLADPEPLFLGILLPLLLASVVLYLATRKVRTMEISYGVD
ncbi:MAG: hypothetical protein JNK60_02575 [Acidobacteria bacterium]|nr:hypothetical protein [Acidobacteriota bacterium]